MRKEYRSRNKRVSGRAGPGGMYCICCNAYRCHPRKMKKFTRRAYRRTFKIETE